mmetsp:Transcript_81075/g.127698  ORF Transcript_81075/g.127698 Transcript_81075/m.127698 type:complete len:82 (-) Transcript_81075:28-273(-)
MCTTQTRLKFRSLGYDLNKHAYCTHLGSCMTLYNQWMQLQKWIIRQTQQYLIHLGVAATGLNTDKVPQSSKTLKHALNTGA